jgi:hypothetical protein
VLDDVQRRRFLIQPARKDPLELVLGIGDVHLDEGARQLLGLPRRGPLAGLQPDDDVVDANGLAGAQRQVPRNAVALVEQPQHRFALRHRRRPGRQLRRRGPHRLGRGLRIVGRIALVAGARATGKRDESGGGCPEDDVAAHEAQSGVQAW